MALRISTITVKTTCVNLPRLVIELQRCDWLGPWSLRVVISRKLQLMPGCEPVSVPTSLLLEGGN
ncbi:hypothetical protein J6590_091019 [Homalodisca vitripennis]|nr:hypothetical protein J6590_091019 [Homalodisca vitripennis]